MISHDRGRWRIEAQLDDIHVLYRIADDSAGTMFQFPGFIHLLATCLYRLRDANFELLQELGVSSENVWLWAAKNLGCDYDFGPDFGPDFHYKHHVNFEYEIRLTAQGTQVSPVRRPIKIGRPRPEHLRRIRVGEHGRVVFRQPSEESNLRLSNAIADLQNHLEVIKAVCGQESSTETTVRYTILSLLDFGDVRGCLENFGVSADDWKSRLNPQKA